MCMVHGLCVLLPPVGLTAHLRFRTFFGWLSQSWTKIQTDEDVVPATGGSMATFFQTPLEWPKLEIEISTWHWRELSAWCTVVMPRISFS
jgi:hypothetical protein